MADKKATPKMIYESQASLYEKAVNTMNADRLIVQHAFKRENYLAAAEMFEQVGNYQDAEELAKKCRELIEQTKKDEVEYRYQLALDQKQLAKSPKGYEKAEKMLEVVAGYKDADKLKEECRLQRELLEKKGKTKKLTKLCILLLLAVAAVSFFRSPAWNVLQGHLIEANSMMTEVAQEQDETDDEEE